MIGTLPTLVAFTGITKTRGPSPQPTGLPYAVIQLQQELPKSKV